MKRKIGWAIVLVIVLATGTWGGIRMFNKKAAPLAASYVTAQVRQGAIEVKISGTGSIQPSAREKLKVNSAGTAAKVNVKQGDKVKKGEILITYEESDISEQLNSKQIDLKKKKLELADLQNNFKAAEDDESRQNVMLSIQKQQLDIEAAQNDLSSLQSDKSIDPIIAPIDGVLATFDVKEGDALNPNSELGEIVNFASLQMVVGIDELDISKVKLNQVAQILVEALPKEVFTGKVVTIADEGTASNGVASFDVTVKLDQSANLKVGMSAEASIMTDKKTDALYVPIEAVQSFQGKYYVMVPGASATAASQAGGKTSGATAQSGQTGQTGPRRQIAGGQASQAGPRGQTAEGQTGQRSQTVEGQTGQGRQSGQGRSGGFSGRQSAATSTGAGATRVAVEVGINNEDNIEIVSGLKVGDSVILPTVVSTANTNSQAGFQGVVGGAIPGGGFQGGGFTGGGRQFSTRSGTAGGGGR